VANLFAIRRESDPVLARLLRLSRVRTPPCIIPRRSYATVASRTTPSPCAAGEVILTRSLKTAATSLNNRAVAPPTENGHEQAAAAGIAGGGFFHPSRYTAAPGYNRWAMVPPAVATHLCLGAVYAWSLMNDPLVREIGVVAPAGMPCSLGARLTLPFCPAWRTSVTTPHLLLPLFPLPPDTIA